MSRRSLRWAKLGAVMVAVVVPSLALLAPAASAGASPCPASPPSVNVRWHYSANGGAGSWSGTGGATCGKTITLGPQAMEGDLRVIPGATIKAGYDFTLPGNKKVQPMVAPLIVPIDGLLNASAHGNVYSATGTHTSAA